MLIHSQEFRDDVGYFRWASWIYPYLENVWFPLRNWWFPCQLNRMSQFVFLFPKTFFCTGFWHRLKYELLPRWLTGKVSACHYRRCRFDPRVNFLEEEMTTHSCILTYRIPWTEEPRGLWSIGSQESDTTERTHTHTHTHTHERWILLSNNSVFSGNVISLHWEHLCYK